jgi:hypothetical protein
MTTSYIRAAAFLAVFGVASTALAQQPAPPQLPPPEPQKIDPPGVPNLPAPQPMQAGVKVADKGPIHEAYAQPGAEVRGQNMTAPKAPPPPVPEVPPETKPEGTNVKWVPGYWQWDADKNDFLWVSGFYRNVPPGRDWQAGQWIERDGKSIYTPGYWRPADMAGVLTNLPEPPKSVENGPSTPVPASNPDAIWITGSWEYRNGQYVWRAGYWAQPYGNMMWVPGQYVYDGNGYTYVPGYWDYPVENRGVLNAPIYVDPQTAQTPGFSYTPQYALGGFGNGYGNGGFFNSLYIGPGYNNYYYGSPYGYAGYGGYGGYGSGYGLGYPFLGIGLGVGYPFGFGYGFPMWGYGYGYPYWGLGGYGYGYGRYNPWWCGHHGYYNSMYHHYQWLNRNNANWAANTRAGYTSRALGLTAPHNGVGGFSGLHGTTVTPHAAAGGVANAAARAAATAHANSIVRPASQVYANHTARATAAGVHANSIPHITSIHPGSGFNGSGFNGAGVRPGVSAGGFTHAAPQIHYGTAGAMTHPGISAGGFTHAAPQVHYGNQIHYGNMSGFRAMPSTTYNHAMPSTFHSAPMYHAGSFGGGGIHYGGGGAMHYGGGGMHYGGGGHVGGGHVGGGHMGGGHGGHR